MEQEFYAGYDISQYAKYYKFPERRLKALALVNHKCSELYNWDGNIVKVDLYDGSSMIGVVRNCCYNFGAELFIDFEIRNLNFIPPFKAFKDENKIIRIDTLNIKDINLLKKGNERFSEKEFAQVEFDIKNHPDKLRQKNYQPRV